MKKLHLAAILSLLFSTLPAADVFREIPIPRYGKLTRESVLSPSGRYFINRVDAADFEVVDLVTDEVVLHSRYSGRTYPDLDCLKPNRVEIALSPDDRYLVGDFYCVRGDTAEPSHWAEVWDLSTRSTVRLFPFRDRDRNDPVRFAYPLRNGLPEGFSVAGTRRHSRNARVVFSPDGRMLCFLFPSLRIFDGRTFEEATGDFNLAGVDRSKTGLITFNSMGAPFFLKSGGAILSFNQYTYLVHRFPSSMRNYTKIEGSVRNVESSRDGSLLILDHKIFLNQFQAVRLALPGTGYLSADDSLILCNGALYSAEPPFDRNIPTLFPGNPTASASREFLFVTDRLRDRLHIYDFTRQGRELQAIPLSDPETLFAEAETGSRFLIRDNASGRVRLFERIGR